MSYDLIIGSSASGNTVRVFDHGVIKNSHDLVYGSGTGYRFKVYSAELSNGNTYYFECTNNKQHNSLISRYLNKMLKTNTIVAFGETVL